MKKYILIPLVVGVLSFTFSSCKSILSTVGSPKQMGSFAKPIALKDTAQVANYIGGYIENSPTRQFAEFSGMENTGKPLDEQPNILQGALSFYQYRDMSVHRLLTFYATYGGSVYGGVIDPKNYYGKELVFKKSLNPYANKYFVGLSASCELGSSIFFNPNKTGISFSFGLGSNFQYQPFGSLRELLDGIEPLSSDLLAVFASPFQYNFITLNIDMRYTYPNRRGNMGLIMFTTLIPVMSPLESIFTLQGKKRAIGFSAYTSIDRFYLDVQFTGSKLLNSPLISVGLQYQLSLEKKKYVEPKKKKRSFWRRNFNFSRKKPVQ